jgi:YVTN family beta-propeller protein
MVVATLSCKDEPADVVFAAGRAFVSCARENVVRVFDVATLAPVATIPIVGLDPRSLAVSADGTRVFAACKLSGNRTTLLPANLAPPQPPPTNISNPPPQVGLIVSADDARLSPQPKMPDNDVAEIDTATLAVTRYFKGVGTVNFHVAVRPGSGELWVANTEARNLVRFEPVLKGHAVDNRVTRIDPAGAGTVTPFDLNPGLDYSQFPNTAAQSIALAQPTALAFTPDGAELWLASFGTDRVAKISPATGAVLARIETGPTTGAASDPRNKRGPRGLALHPTNGRLYVLNRLSNTITIVATASETAVAEIPIGSVDPTPTAIRQGRGFLYDARLSGNGTQSCASCHIDGDRDELAWDLGDPAGTMQTVTTPFGPFTMHPMKGPMTTQTLRGLNGVAPLHWRGDRTNFNAFNGAFATLLGGPPLATADMNAFRTFVETMLFEPNPNRNLDNTMPGSFPPGDPNAGDPNAGRATFLNEDYQTNLRCSTCHSLPRGTSNGLIIASATLQLSQDFKVPHLRNMYQKRHFTRSATAVSLSGFGLVHDGSDPDFFTFFSHPVFGTFAGDTTRKRNLSAFMHCFETGTAPAVGYTRSLHAGNVAAVGAEWAVLEAQATGATANIDLVVRLLIEGRRRAFLYRPATNDYLSDQTGYGPLPRSGLAALVVNGASGFVMGVPRLSGTRLAIDRDGDTVPDGDEPIAAPAVSRAGGVAAAAWSALDPHLVLEWTDSLVAPDWQPVLEPRTTAAGQVNVADPTAGARRFYRLRRP